MSVNSVIVATMVIYYPNRMLTEVMLFLFIFQRLVKPLICAAEKPDSQRGTASITVMF